MLNEKTSSKRKLALSPTTIRMLTVRDAYRMAGEKRTVVDCPGDSHGCPTTTNTTDPDPPSKHHCHDPHEQPAPPKPPGGPGDGAA